MVVLGDLRISGPPTLWTHGVRCIKEGCLIVRGQGVRAVRGTPGLARRHLASKILLAVLPWASYHGRAPRLASPNAARCSEITRMRAFTPGKRSQILRLMSARR